MLDGKLPAADGFGGEEAVAETAVEAFAWLAVVAAQLYQCL